MTKNVAYCNTNMILSLDKNVVANCNVNIVRQKIAANCNTNMVRYFDKKCLHIVIQTWYFALPKILLHIVVQK